MIRPLPPALDRAEALRYLGGAGKEVPPSVNVLLDRAAAELWRTAAPRAVVRRVSADKLGPLLAGRDIAAHLKGCDEGVLLAVTLGAGVDSALRRAMATDMAYGVVLDAAASTLVEQLANDLENEQRALMEQEGRYMTGRFSPGYGDWPITVQPAFVQWLDAGRQAGICSTASCVLTPGKSITALCGAADHPVKGKLAGCATCALRETCTKRKEGKPCAQ